MDFKIGADPELFVRDVSTGDFVNADGMVKGTKREPEPVELGAVQVDGMALEFNIDPATSEDEFKNNIISVKNTLNKMIGHDSYELMPLPSVIFSDDVMKAASDEAKALGCDPDYNAWMFGDINPMPNANTNMRTGAGHIHIGWTEDKDVYDSSHMDACIKLIKQLDCSLGVQSLLWDKDFNRRDLYGKGGAFRPKSYGVEYRVLSNAWLTSTDLIGHVYNVTVKSAQDLVSGINYFEEGDAESIINNNDVNAAVVWSNNLFEKHSVPCWR